MVPVSVPVLLVLELELKSVEVTESVSTALDSVALKVEVMVSALSETNLELRLAKMKALMLSEQDLVSMRVEATATVLG